MLRANLTIQEVAARTLVSETTLRMWEARYGFPAPARLPTGHRRYSARDVDDIHAVLRYRAQGLSLKAAVGRVRGDRHATGGSVFGHLRREGALHVQRLGAGTLGVVMDALEDEVLVRAEPAVLVRGTGGHPAAAAAVQRWEEIARSAQAVVVVGPDGDVPADVRSVTSITSGEGALAQERFAVVDESTCASVVAARPMSAPADVPIEEREWETIWSVEPAIVRSCALLCLRSTPDGALADLVARLDGDPVRAPTAEAVAATALRMLAYLTR